MSPTTTDFEPWTAADLAGYATKLRMLGRTGSTDGVWFGSTKFNEASAVYCPRGSKTPFEVNPSGGNEWKTVSEKQFLLFLNQHRLPFEGWF